MVVLSTNILNNRVEIVMNADLTFRKHVIAVYTKCIMHTDLMLINCICAVVVLVVVFNFGRNNTAAYIICNILTCIE